MKGASMSYGTTQVLHNGSTVTFHRNKRAAHRGFIYVDGRRVYGTIGAASPDSPVTFTPGRVLAGV
jgi:hypothetical protein